MSEARNIILGAGMTGLGAALSTNLPVYEAANQPGGVCHSYYLHEDGKKRDPLSEDVSECFRFEPAGGHWLFGVAEPSLKRLEEFCTLRKYVREAAVYFPRGDQLIPYPLQDNIRYFDNAVRDQILAEICSPQPGSGGDSPSFKDWLLTTFGPTLCDLFFLPFNERYTAGICAHIAPQDLGKSAINRDKVLRGAFESTEDTGYNRVFYYPAGGLDQLVRAMSAACSIYFEHQVTRIDTSEREVNFANGAAIPYHRIISTIPLNRMVNLCEIECSEPPDPATAVLVVNIGAVKARDCSLYHWIYLPSSKSAMHRVGFYSHVDASFLPTKYRGRSDVVSLYAERSFPGGFPPTRDEQDSASGAIVNELKEWGFIAEAIVVDSTFTDPAYTWSRRGSGWVPEAIHRLAQLGIHQIGRYGAWRFQGMVESFEQGLFAGGMPKT